MGKSYQLHQVMAPPCCTVSRCTRWENGYVVWRVTRGIFWWSLVTWKQVWRIRFFKKILVLFLYPPQVPKKKSAYSPPPKLQPIAAGMENFRSLQLLCSSNWKWSLVAPGHLETTVTEQNFQTTSVSLSYGPPNTKKYFGFGPFYTDGPFYRWTFLLNFV